MKKNYLYVTHLNLSDYQGPLIETGLHERSPKTQIWIAICVYLLVACLNKHLKIDENLSRILQVLSVNVFQKHPINQLFTKEETENCNTRDCNQLIINGF